MYLFQRQNQLGNQTMAVDTTQQHNTRNMPVMPRHDRRLDRIFFSFTSLLMLVTVFVGFSRTYYLAGVFRAPLPSLVLHLHAVAFSLWVPLLIVQTSLVSAKRVDLHRKLGIAGFLLGCSMVVLGVLAAIDSMARSFPSTGRAALTFFIVPITDISVFAILLFFAFRCRLNPSAHKRLIYIATTGLLAAAFGRMPLPGTASVSIAALYSYIFLIILVAYDRRSMHKVHRATLWASALLIFVQQTRYPIGQTEAWQSFATRVAHLYR